MKYKEVSFFWKIGRMQSLSISYETPEQFSLLKNYVDDPGFDFVRSTNDLVDVLVTADKIEEFKQLLEEHRMNYTVMIEDVQQLVTEEYITQEVERRLQAGTQDYASGRLSFTYYPNYKEVSKVKNFKDYKKKRHQMLYICNSCAHARYRTSYKYITFDVTL